jgi:hypothetical protein
MARNNIPRVPDGSALPGGGGGVHGPKVSRQIINSRRRKINAALRKKAAGINDRREARADRINANRRATAKAAFQRDAQAPSYRDDEAYKRTVGTANANLQNSLSGLSAQRRELGINYGLGEAGGSVASNPYSRAALLQKSYDQNQVRTQNSMAASGQLYSGATQNARNLNVGNYGQARDSLQKDFDARMGQTIFGEQQARDGFASAQEAAEARARQNAQKTKAATMFDSPVYQKPKVFKPKAFKPKFRSYIPPINKPKLAKGTGGVRP